MKNISFVLLIISLLFSCRQNDDVDRNGIVAKLRVVMPENQTAQGVKVEWINRVTGAAYSGIADSEGVTVCEVEAGIYRVTAQHRLVEESENREEQYSGSLDEVVVGEAGVDLVLQLAHVRLSRLVIKEIYYAGCRTDDGQSYKNDNYLTLHNNSADTLWLDGICIGLVYPPQLIMPSPWLQDNPEMPQVPVSQMGWQFKGAGKEYPLLPGGEAVVAVNAVNHTGGVYGHSKSVDLSQADWAFYRDDFNPEYSAITPGVKTMELFWLNWQGTLNPSFSLGAGGSGLVVYRMEGDAKEYAVEHLQNTPGMPESQVNLCLMVPREWVLDYVECVGGVNFAGYKRVPAMLDRSAVFMSGGAWTGKSLCRRVVSQSGERLIYQDTNDSANDFLEQEPALKRK